MSARKEAALRLGVELEKKYRALVNAQGDEAIQKASIELGSLFNANIFQVIWFLKQYGGAQQRPLERLATQPHLKNAEPIPAPPALPEIPEFLKVAARGV